MSVKNAASAIRAVTVALGAAPLPGYSLVDVEVERSGSYEWSLARRRDSLVEHLVVALTPASVDSEVWLLEVFAGAADSLAFRREEIFGEEVTATERIADTLIPQVELAADWASKLRPEDLATPFLVPTLRRRTLGTRAFGWGDSKGAARKSAADKGRSGKAAAKKAPPRKAAAKKAPARKFAAKKAPAKKLATRKAPAKAAAKKAPARKAAAKKTPAKKAAAKKSTAKKSSARR